MSKETWTKLSGSERTSFVVRRMSDDNFVVINYVNDPWSGVQTAVYLNEADMKLICEAWGKRHAGHVSRA